MAFIFVFWVFAGLSLCGLFNFRPILSTVALAASVFFPGNRKIYLRVTQLMKEKSSPASSFEWTSHAGEILYSAVLGLVQLKSKRYAGFELATRTLKRFGALVGEEMILKPPFPHRAEVTP